MEKLKSILVRNINQETHKKIKKIAIDKETTMQELALSWIEERVEWEENHGEQH